MRAANKSGVAFPVDRQLEFIRHRLVFFFIASTLLDGSFAWRYPLTRYAQAVCVCKRAATWEAGMHEIWDVGDEYLVRT